METENKHLVILISLFTLFALNSFGQAGFFTKLNTYGAGINQKWSGNSIVEKYNGDILTVGVTHGMWVDSAVLATFDAGGAFKSCTVNTELTGGPFSPSTNATKIIKTIEGGYAMVGIFLNQGTGNDYDGYLFKCDSNMNGVFTFLNFGTKEFINSVIEDDDSSFIVVGHADTANGHTNLLISKINASGFFIWSKTINQFLSSQALCIAKTQGGYLIGGYHTNLNSSNQEINMALLLKVDKNGNLIWSKEVTSPVNANDFYNSRINDLHVEGNGDIILAGLTYSGNIYGERMFSARCDSTGNPLWSKIISNYSVAGAKSVIELADSSLFFVGDDVNVQSARVNICVAKVNPGGTVIWTKSIAASAGYDLKVNSAIKTSDGGIICTGLYDPTGELFVLKSDTALNSCLSSSVQTADVNYGIFNPVTVQLSSISVLASPAWLLVSNNYNLQATGCNSTLLNEENDTPFKVYPDPFNRELNINMNRNEQVEITLFDMASRKLIQQQFTNSVTLNTEDLSKGIYFYELRSSDGKNKSVIKTGKVVKQ